MGSVVVKIISSAGCHIAPVDHPIRKIMCDALRDLVTFVQFKNVENSHGGVLFLVKLKAKTYNFTKNNTLPCLFSYFLICTNGKNRANHHIYNRKYLPLYLLLMIFINHYWNKGKIQNLTKKNGFLFLEVTIVGSDFLTKHSKLLKEL